MHEELLKNMAYDEAHKRATLKYTKDKLKTVHIRYKNMEFEQRILPAAERSGLPVATFFKEAVNEKIERDQLDKENDK